MQKMKRTRWQKSLAILLAVLMLLPISLTSVTAYAQETEQASTGLCVHHPQHTADCGYQEAGEGVDGSPCQYAQSGCPYCVVSWCWADGQNNMTEDENGWVLSVPGASEENPLTAEGLRSILPTQIQATMGDNSTKTLDLTWDLTGIPATGAVSGDYTLTASLGTIAEPDEEGGAEISAPDEAKTSLEENNFSEETGDGSGENTAEPSDKYALASGAAPLTVMVKISSEALLSGNSGTDENPEDTENTEETLSSDHVVVPEEAYPSGTVINLFDYWIDERTNADNNDPTNHTELGINQDHALKFRYGGTSGWWNAWTGGGGGPRTGIVQATLGENGYPTLNNLDNKYNESLAYLFDPETNHNGKLAFSNVGGLFQVDEDGYYYYNSQKNYAWFNEETEAFVLYDAGGVKKGGTSPDGQFFPFVNPTKVFTEDDSGQLVQKNINSKDPAINHYFGLTMSTRFVQKNGGTTYGQQPVTYNFSGDDDVWIFIDNVLVADLGGIHDMCGVQIDFETGEIILYTDKNFNNKYDDGVDKEWQTTTLRAQFATVLGESNLDSAEWSGETFADNTYHTLKFFYLERGNTDSNMSLKYNMVPIPESEITKVDQLGNKLEDITFALYPAQKTTAADGTESYDIKAGYMNSPIWTGRTGDDGSLVLWDEATNSPLVFQELAEAYQTNYFILREKEVPEGYRKISDTYLEYIPETGLILSDDYWSTGAYAQPKITTTATTKLYAEDDKNAPVFDSSTSESLPTVFAVVFKRLDMEEKVDDENNWAPVSGNVEDGWKVWDDTAVPLAERIKSAAEANKTDGQNKFELDTSGAFQVTLENLPGDITTYYWYLQQSGVDPAQAKYTVNYYYKDADDHLIRLYTDDFDRAFSTHLYIPNVKNYLLVQKVDEDGNPIAASATFALYAEDQVTQNNDGTYTFGTPYETVSTGTLETPKMQSAAIFGSKTPLKKGNYYLVETQAPDGYIKSSQATKVIVDDTGVYADAGDKEDGVAVFRGVGSILKSMLQFAVDDHVDTTLHDIQAVMQTGTETENKLAWDTVEESSWRSALHLSYSTNAAMLEYGPSDLSGPVALMVDEGWGRLSIRQCYQHDSNINTDLKTNLGTQDITSLFSGTCTVQVTNVRNAGDLTVSKTVTGSGASSDQKFSFTVTLRAAVTGTYGEMEFTDGVATFTLKHGESKTATDLPAGVSYTVTETPVEGYTVTSPAGGTISGTITAGQNAYAAFTNAKNDTPDSSPNPGTPDEPNAPNPSEPPAHSDSSSQPDVPHIPQTGDSNPSEPPAHSDSSSHMPQTGDASMINLWVLLCLVSLGGLCLTRRAALVSRNRKIRKK